MASGKVVIRYTPKKGYVFVTTTDSGGQAPTVTLPDGTTMTAVRADKVGGTFANDESGRTEYQWVFPGLEKYNGAEASFSFGGATQSIPLNPTTEYRTESQGIGGLDAAPNKALSGGGGSFPAGLNPSQYGAGYLPAYLGGQFPQFQPIQYNPIQAPDYKMFDPAKYAEKYGPVIRSEMMKNYNLAEGFSFSTLSNELKGLKAYVPASAALARTEAAVDNLQNQNQRTQQLDRALPGVREGLAGQTERAATYATGHLLDTFDDNSLEVGIRSRAADTGTARGFGANSFATQNISDKMNAEERFKIAQYGEQLTASNATARANLELAPTEYINAGQQVAISPKVGAGEYISKYFSEANQLSQIPGTSALNASIGQSQFSAGQQSQTNQFNATNALNTDMYNASNIFAAQQGLFNYNQGFANQAADNMTAQTNQNREDQQRQELTNTFKQESNKAQQASTIKSILGGLGYAPQLITAVSSLIDTFSSDDYTPSSTTPTYEDYSPSTDPLVKPTEILDYDTAPTNHSSFFSTSFASGSTQFGYNAETGQLNNPFDFGRQYGIDYEQYAAELGY